MALRMPRPTAARTLSLVAAYLLAAGLSLAGAAAAAEDALRSAFFALQSRAASGQLHVVEMDAASIASLERWPWPRRHYGNVVDQLSAAGARSITFDVDFSSSSDPREDALFAAALARAAGKVTLPTFAQQATLADRRVLDALPIAQLREHSALASVAVAPDKDGLVRSIPLGTVTAGVPRPSLSAQIAGQSGTAGLEIPLDLSIDPATVPRHSFVDVENGRFDPKDIAGKDVLIGATAIEMGDRYAVPRFGVIPGVIVQALAAETLYSGVPVSGGTLLPLVAAALLSFWIVRSPRKRAAAVRGTAAVLTVFLCQWLAWSVMRTLLDVAPALIVTGSTALLTVAVLFRAELMQRRLQDPATGLPNKLAMIEANGSAEWFTIAASVAGFERLQTVLGEQHSADLVRRLAERLAIGNGGQTIYRIEDRTLAWFCALPDFRLEQELTVLYGMMRNPVEIGGRRIDVQMAFGIAQGGALAEASHSASEALRNGSRWQYHQAAERDVLERRVSLMGELDDAIVNQDLKVLYQPKLHLESDRIGSVEALVRWDHPERGFMRPDLFIPMAEEADRITDLTLFVLQKTIDDLRGWCDQGHVITAAVNISARLVASQAFISAAEALLIRNDVPRSRLIFEVTESAAIADPTAAAAALRRFGDLGVAISMDDYGTGQSSLSYLKQLPLSELKIDRSFVQHAHVDASDAMLVRSTVNLAHELGLTVVAEGVEEPACLDFLRGVGCDYAQGYLIGKPMPAEALMMLLNERQEPAPFTVLPLRTDNCAESLSAAL